MVSCFVCRFDQRRSKGVRLVVLPDLILIVGCGMLDPALERHRGKVVRRRVDICSVNGYRLVKLIEALKA